MSYGLYMHLPFCRKKCSYCGFISFPHMEDRMEMYALSAARELELRCRGVFSGNPQTVYIGGGTPSAVPARLIAVIMRDVVISADGEYTVEANPESIAEPWLEDMLALGANRLSIGVQALDDRLLENLGRLHTASQARTAVKTARVSGFRNLSIDLMFGIPGQTLESWKQTIEEAISLEVEHISAYSLGVEEDTPFFELSRLGGLSVPDSSETADMYLFLSEELECHGFSRYEISNFALPNHECSHNRGYWNFSPYLGIGVSAHSFDGAVRRWNTSDISAYIERCGSNRLPTYEEEIIDTHARALETLLLSLRTVEGLDMDAFLARFPVNAENIRDKIVKYIRERLMERNGGGYVRLTGRGMLISDDIMGELAMEISEK
jgi:oxygen-independent coproporphyrinogen III oxidase